MTNELKLAVNEAAQALAVPSPGEKRAKEYPNRKEIIRIIKDLQAVLFPGIYHAGRAEEPVLQRLTRAARQLSHQIELAAKVSGISLQPDELTAQFIQRLPNVRAALLLDVEALYEGDPAAKSRQEILLCYPGFYAICIYRLAHELYRLQAPLLPRMMTEFAHEKTGIDIHAGATIGRWFFIDHGTGVVVGETAVIGEHVKLYQGVTLGAKSFELDENGLPVKGVDRHPKIGDHVVIYANATILGGDTRVGANSVIGGSVWLTHSVPAGSVLTCDATPVLRQTAI